MKKVLSAAMALIIAVSTLAFGTTSAYAKKLGTEIKLNSTVNVTLKEEDSGTFGGTYSSYINFTPDKTGFYEFTTNITTKGNDSYIMQILDASKNSSDLYYLVNYRMFPTEENLKGEKVYAAAKLTAKKTYNIKLSSYNGSEKVSITATTHKTHKMSHKQYEPGSYDRFYRDGKLYTYKRNGYDYRFCIICGKKEVGKEVYKPYSSVTLSKLSYVYDGKKKTPTVTVLDENGKKVSSKYYTVDYVNNKKVGYSLVDIWRTNSMDEKHYLRAEFYVKILPSGTSISSISAAKKGFSVKYKKQSTQTTGYQIQYSTDKNFKKNTKTATVSKNSTTSKKITNLKAKKKYYVRIRTYKTVTNPITQKKQKLCSSWSKVKTVTTKK